MAHNPKRPHVDDAFVRELIRRKTRLVIGRTGLRQQDRDDLEQLLRLCLVQRLATFVPGRSSAPTFVATVIDHFLANLLRDRRAAKRDVRRTRLLDNAEATGGTARRADHPLSQPQQDARRGRRRRDGQADAELRLDLETVLSSLTPRERELCELLMHLPLADAARAANLPRSTYADQIRKLRQRFEDAGLRDYL